MGALLGENDDGYAWQTEMGLLFSGKTDTLTIAPYISKVIICSGVTNISDYAFAFDAFEIKKVIMSNDVVIIGNRAFYDCVFLNDVQMSENLININNGAFDACMSLKNITIPDSVTRIGSSAFSDCASLTNITIPSSVTSIEDFTFSFCSNLTTVTIDSKVIATTIANANDNGGIVEFATTIYINEKIEEANIGSYITSNYTKQATSDKEGYVKYTK